MSSELNELRNSLRVAAASVKNDDTSACESSCSETIMSSSEAAVQAILEALKNNEFLKAIHYIRECRCEKLDASCLFIMSALKALIANYEIKHIKGISNHAVWRGLLQ